LAGSRSLTSIDMKQPSGGEISTARRIFRNFFSLYSAEIVTNLLRFLAVAYLARILGVQAFGEIGFATAVLAYFTLLINLGLDTFGVREVARDPSLVKNYVGNILGIRILGSLLSFALLLAFVSLIPKPPQVKNLILLYGLGIFSFSLSLDWAFLGIEKMQYVALSRILRQISYLGLILLLIAKPEQILTVPLVQFASAMVAVFVLTLVFAGKFGFYRIQFDLVSWKGILRQSLPMGLSFIMIQVYYNFDVVILGFMKSEQEVGWYTAAYKIILLVNAIGLIYYNTIFPIISRYYKTSQEKLQTLLNHTAKLMCTAIVPLGVGGVFAARQILDFVYGKEFLGGILAFQILIWVVAIIWISCIYGNSLLACDRQKQFLVGVSLGAVTNVLANLILIPRLSLVGAAISTILAEGVVFIYMYRRFSEIIRIPFARYLPKPLAASLVMGLFMFWVRNQLSLFPLVFAAIAVYFSLIFLLRGITWQEIVELKKQIARRTQPGDK